MSADEESVMATQNYPAFDEEVIAASLKAAQQNAKSLRKELTADANQFEHGTLKVGAQCISVTVQNGQACLHLPIVGDECISVPSWVPNGSACSACLDICTKMGFPCGIQVTLSLAGQQILQKTFGCSC
jgi:hypothetical protein